MKYIIIVGFILLSTIAFAVNYPSVTWICTNKNKININADGSINLKFEGTATAPVVTIGYASVTIISTNTYKMSINNDGSLNVVTK